MTVQEFIESHRTVKRLKRLPVLKEAPGKVSKIQRGNIYQHTRTGFRSDLGILTRSSWESNFARILTIHGIKFEFEPEVFPFPVKKGTKAYVPDFYLPKTNEYIEIKGFFDDKSRIKIKRFSLHYPDKFEKLTMIISRSSTLSKTTAAKLGVPTVLYYEDFRDVYKPIIKNWEGK